MTHFGTEDIPKGWCTPNPVDVGLPAWQYDTSAPSTPEGARAHASFSSNVKLSQLFCLGVCLQVTDWARFEYFISGKSDAMLHSPRPMLYLSSYNEELYLDPACFLHAVLDSDMYISLPVLPYIPKLQLWL